MRPHGCFACGELNVSGLRLQLHADAGICWAEPTLDERFMGWEGIAHGGIVCAILDEVMAWALVDEDCWGLTARMSVDFRRPVPVGLRLRAEGRVAERRRRVIHTEGRLLDAADRRRARHVGGDLRGRSGRAEGRTQATLRVPRRPRRCWQAHGARPGPGRGRRNREPELARER